MTRLLILVWVLRHIVSDLDDPYSHKICLDSLQKQLAWEQWGLCRQYKDRFQFQDHRFSPNPQDQLEVEFLSLPQLPKFLVEGGECIYKCIKPVVFPGVIFLATITE